MKNISNSLHPISQNNTLKHPTVLRKTLASPTYFLHMCLSRAQTLVVSFVIEHRDCFFSQFKVGGIEDSLSKSSADEQF